MTVTIVTVFFLRDIAQKHYKSLFDCFYFHYIPDHARRIEAAIRWVTEHGYKPVFFHEGFLGGRE